MMAIAIISALISSMALAGVAVSLLLQARQLRTNQLQVSRAAQSQLISMALAHSQLVSEAVGASDPDLFAKSVYINWRFKYMELSYSVGAISAAAVHRQASAMFAAEFPRHWWTENCEAYRIEAATKLEQNFVTIVDEAFRQVIKLQGPGSSDDESSGQSSPLPSSS